jgi:hypothetical protein
MIIGYIQENYVYYEEDLDLLKFKNVEVKFPVIEKAYKSTIDIIQIKEDLKLIKNDSFIKIGCLDIKKDNFINMYNKVKKLRNARIKKKE